MLTRPDLQAHTNYSEGISWIIDHQLDLAASHSVYIKSVIEEKSDSFYDCIQPDGTWGASSNENLYASQTSANRTFQTYFWRYLIARWSYSTALHSVEFVNEGDPFDGNHQAAVAALGSYFESNDPNKHLVTTSNWHSFPPSMWRQPQADYADLHMYMGWGVASGGNRLTPGWDGGWTGPNNVSDPGPGFQIDNTVAHTGNASLKMTVPASPGACPTSTQSNLVFQCGLIPGHQVSVSAWVKSQNTYGYSESPWKNQGLYLWFSQNGGDFAGYPSTGDLTGPQGTYDWQQVQVTFTVPANANLLGVQPRYWFNNNSANGYFWIDDIVVQDLTTGAILNYNGGFEYQDSESYDVAGGHQAYSILTHSFENGKPSVRGEVGFCYPQRFTNPYKGYSYTGEDQSLVDNTAGIWWKKWVWSNVDAGGLYEIYWWNQVLLTGNFLYGKAYQNFMAGIPLSNGNYVEAAAAVSNPQLRVMGQKDLVNNRAHLWIDNVKCTWYNIVSGVNIPPVNGTLTLSGLKTGTYTVEWWDTTAGAITQTQQVPAQVATSYCLSRICNRIQRARSTPVPQQSM